MEDTTMEEVDNAIASWKNTTARRAGGTKQESPE